MASRPLLVLFGLCGILGCAQTAHLDYIQSYPVTMPQRSRDADRLWASAQQALRNHQFRLDRVDRRAGVITTAPETSKQFFEFWRNDTASGADLLESTLNPIRRRVQVTLTWSKATDNATLEVAVYKQRLSSPDRQFNSTGAVYQIFSDTLPSTTGIAVVTPEHDRWIDLGRDPALEDRLLRQIVKLAGLDRAAPVAGPSGEEPSE